MTDSQTCNGKPRGWHVDCGKPLKTDEQREAGKCGIHLAAERRQANYEAARQAAITARAMERGSAQAAANELSRLGVSATVSDGAIALTVTDARNLASALRLLQRRETTQ